MGSCCNCVSDQKNKPIKKAPTITSYSSPYKSYNDYNVDGSTIKKIKSEIQLGNSSGKKSTESETAKKAPGVLQPILESESE